MKKLLITFYDLVTVLVSDRKAGILWWLRARAVKCIPIFFPSFFFKDYFIFIYHATSCGKRTLE